MKRDHGVVEAAAALVHLDRYDTVIDVRSESEYAEDRIPGAISCPVLDDAERHEVGTMDRQQSSFEARRRGAALVARNIARHLEERFADRPRDWRPLVYCWRGGNRSSSMVHILSRVGWRAEQLDGGYRAYRRAVMAALDTLPAQLEFRVICGPTGSGKSRLLQHLAALGAQVLDLEALACHRGSVLGGLPMQPQPGQKLFESLIWDRLRRFDPMRPVFVESESRKVGSLHVPDQLLLRMRESGCIALHVPLPTRVGLLREEYGHFEQDPGLLRAQLDCLVELHGREKVASWKALAHAQQWDRMVEQLLTDHYDPAYRRSIARNFKESATAARLAIISADSAAYTAAAQSLVR
jgi:tRNA 2-selenouridine synthase